MGHQNIEVQRINTALKNLGSTIDGKPKFRVVWSDDQFEIRRGRFEEHYGALYLKTVQGIREVKKYPWIKKRWILEIYQDRSKYPGFEYELPCLQEGTYEPLYVFEDAKRNYLPPNKEVVDQLTGAILNPVMDKAQFRDAHQDEVNENLQQQKEEKYYEDYFNQEERTTQLIREGSGIYNP